MQAIGKLLQLFGLIALPVAMVAQLTGGLKVAQLLVVLVFGFAAFWLGRILEGYGK